jgi:hypothetical protein
LRKDFYGKKQNFPSWDYSPLVPDCQDSHIIGRRVKGLLL